MPRGGARKGAGRKKGSANVKSRQIVDEAAADGRKLPLAHMLDILNDPKASQARKDWAAGCAASYCHPRLSASATASMKAPASSSSSEPVVFHVWALPSGCQIGEGNEVIWPDGTTSAAPPLKPYQPTPDWPALTDRTAEPEPQPFEVEELVPPENVTVLDPYRRKRDDEGPAGAA